MATKKAKPDGQYHLQCENVETYMAEIPIQDLPGVGSSTTFTLKESNLLTCGDLQKVSLPRLQMLVGKKFGETLYQYCRGIDQRVLSYSQIRKSVSAEVNYGIRFKTYEELETFLKQLCEEVHRRLTDIKRKTKCVTLKLMVRAKEAPVETSKFMGHGVCDYLTKSVSLSEFTNDLEIITRCVLNTMKALNQPPHELRGIGIQLTKLDDPTEQLEKPKENIIKTMFSKVLEKQKEKEKEEKKVETKDNDNDLNKAKLEEAKKISIKKDNQKSPDLKKTGSTKRGRPRAVGNNKETQTAPNVIGMLKNAAAKQAHLQVRTITEATLPDDIDPEVFNALPLDIREEILRDISKQVQHKPNEDRYNNIRKTSIETNIQHTTLNDSDLLPSTSKAAQDKRDTRLQQQNSKFSECMEIDPEFMIALPPELRLEVEQQMKRQKQSNNHDQSYKPITPPCKKNQNFMKSSASTQVCEISRDNIFTQKNCIELLLAWLQNCDVPENYDIDLMSSNARELVRGKELDKLYEALLYLGRLIKQKKISSNDCPWHMAFNMILEAVQAEMLEVYDGRQLLVPVKIKCDACSNKV